MKVRVELLFLYVTLSLMPLSSSEVGDGETDDCTSGFMSRERIHALLSKLRGNYLERFYYGNWQAIIPGMNFTCSGNIHSWIFGARWDGHTELFTELQIWRSSGNGSYTKVGSTTIMTERNTTELYKYPLPSPLPFQEGDILGFYQPAHWKSQLGLLFEFGYDRRVHYILDKDSPASDLNISNLETSPDKLFHLLISVETDSPGCECGFMSMERMRILLGLDSVGGVIPTRDRRQQITPDMKFTCDGIITKWIIGAMWGGNAALHPELQLWREIGNDTYQKINGTLIAIETESDDGIYEYDNFSPIPFQAGDILGVFIPPFGQSKLRLRSESRNDPTNYFISTGEHDMSPYETIDLQNTTPQVNSVVYHPLVTVDISVNSSSTADPTYISSTTSASDAATVSTAPPDVTSFVSPGITDVGTNTGSQSSVGAGVGVGVGAAVVLLVVVGVLGVGLFCVWRRRYPSKVVLPASRNIDHLENPVYESETVGGSGNIAANKAGVCSSRNDYELAGSHPPPSSHDGVVVEFDNILYAERGPTAATEDDCNKLNDIGVSSSTAEYCYVPTIAQRNKKEEQKDQDNLYSTPYTGGGSQGQQEYFKESDIYWAPAATVTGLYEQLSHYKYREIIRHHIEITGSLGSGEFGVVSRGRWQAAVGGPVDVAIKTLRPSAEEKDTVKFLQEAAINGQFHHPNIVQLHGVVTVGEPVMIVLEYMPNGDLRNFLHSLKEEYDPSQQSGLPQLCLSFSRQIASGMSYLARKAFVHRDLAARNVLVSENRICKVSDFGMARDLEEATYYVSHGGKIPVKWTAPEALYYKKYSTASDVWSFGCLVYEIWSLGHKPFEGYTNSQVLKLVNDGKRLTPPPGCPRPIYSVMISCWHPEKSSRPSFSSLYQTLNGESASLLQLREEDSHCHPQASLLGAELSAGQDLFTDLQETYMQ